MKKYRVLMKEPGQNISPERDLTIEVEAEGVHIDLLFHGTLAFLVDKQVVEVFPLSEIRRARLVRED